MSAGEDIEINIWDASIDSIEPVAVIVDHFLAINCVTVYDDFLYSGSSDTTVKQWNLTQFALNKIYEGYPLTIISLTADQSYVYASGFARLIYQWNASSSVLAGRFEGHSDDVSTLKLSSSLLFSGSKDQTVRVWNVQSKKTEKVFNCKPLPDTNLW
jgi:WD40 repeat protein